MYTFSFLLLLGRSFVFQVLFKQLWINLCFEQRHDFGQVVSVPAAVKTKCGASSATRKIHSAQSRNLRLVILLDDTLPRWTVEVVLLLHIDAHIVVLVQLEPVHLAVFVPANGLQTHLVWILLIDGCFELDIFIKLALAQVLKKRGDKLKVDWDQRVQTFWLFTVSWMID